MSDRFNATIAAIEKLLRTKTRIILAIDGRCAAGKTTLASHLQNNLNCNVFHMDDFFLRPEQRTPERFEIPGGNVDYERFLEEVLLPIYRGEDVSYKPYDCHTQMLKKTIAVRKNAICIVEGAYSCHPALWEYYDLHIFLSVNPEEQMRRIALRNKEMAEMFRNKWIPLEERYISAYQIEERCDMRFL